MNLCITGALGHIGSSLIRNLSLPSLGRVHLVDNLLTQRYPSLFGLPDDINYCFHQVDILSEGIGPIIKDSDVVIHLAAITDAESSFHKPELIENINKKGLENVAHLCAEHQCSLIFPSSTSVYGVQEGAVDEDCSENDLKPQSPYAESKLYGEKLLCSLAKEKGLKCVVLRLGTIFGYSIGMRFHTAVNKFTWQAALGEPVTVWRTALDQKRPYCDLRDCIRSFTHVIENNIFDGEIYNISTINLTVGDIVNTLKEYNPQLKVEFVDSPIMNQLSYDVSTQKSIQRGFTYRGNLTESIKETLQKLKNVRSHEVSLNV